ncbi:MAG: aspartate aminotransferase family protein [Anaerolineae bacterium]
MSSDIIETDAQYVLKTYKRAPFVLTSGRGMTVYDSEGRAYLDFGAGIAVNALGHAEPEIAAAIQQQAATLSHVCNLYHTAPQAELARSLCELSFADRVYFCNSGAEAVEAAIKFARKYALTTHGPGKTGIVSFSGAFHGRTMGALALTPREKYQAPFRPLMPGVTHAPFNDVEAAGQVIGPETAAVFVEPVQGEGGIHAATQEFMETLRVLCDRHGALLVFDEIQCGLGRTGKLWAHEHYGMAPDMMTLAKALGGGLPMGAVLLTGEVAATIEVGDHGSTFAGGPVVAQAARVVLKRVSDPALLAHIRGMGDLMRERLAGLASPHIRAVRGLGLMIGVELDMDVTPVIEAGYAHGLILLNAGPNVLRLLPPYIVSVGDIDQLIDGMGQILASLES